MADTKTAPSQKPFIATNTQPRAIHTCGITLTPGKPTPIPPEHVEALKKSPAWRARWIVEGEAPMPAPVMIQIAKIDDVAKVLKLIAVESDLSTLNAWADAEKRPQVLEAIRNRVANL